MARRTGQQQLDFLIYSLEEKIRAQMEALAPSPEESKSAYAEVHRALGVQDLLRRKDKLMSQLRSLDVAIDAAACDYFGLEHSDYNRNMLSSQRVVNLVKLELDRRPNARKLRELESMRHNMAFELALSLATGDLKEAVQKVMARLEELNEQR